MPDFDFEGSMGGSFQSVAHSLDRSRIQAGQGDRQSLILHPDAQQAGNTLLNKVKFTACDDGSYSLMLTGPDAPIDARIIYNMLEEAGAFEPQKQSLGGTDRVVIFSISPESREQLAKNFNGVAESLARQTDTLTRIIVASNALDRLSTDEKGSKLNIKIAIPPEARTQPPTGIVKLPEKFEIGLSINVVTNDPALIEKFSQAKFTSSPITSFQLSNMQSIKGGQRFIFTPEQLDPALAVIMNFVREQDEAAPKLTHANPALKARIEQRPNPLDQTSRQDILH